MQLRYLAFAWCLAACNSKQTQQLPDGAVQPDGAAAVQVTFSYTPAWDGVQAVDVVGGFGQSGDWTTPLVSLTAGSGGTFTGTAMLPVGQYLYLFHAVGDAAAGAKAATYPRYVFDPASSAFAACPAASPTYTMAAPNPCSRVTLPEAAPPALAHVRGTVMVNAAPAAGYLVLLEREEPMSHHFFVNRVTTASDGTYDLMAVAGTYRVQVQHPEYESKTDAQLAPGTLNILRRSLTSPFAVAADVAVSNAELAFARYASFAPQTTATLPTTFSFGASTMATHLDVYGTAMAGAGQEIGDPWFGSAATQAGTMAFDGTFTTKQATETAVALGEHYFWGVTQTAPADSAGVVWAGQSMVLPITWH